jgi:hypothetical protein
MRQTTYANAVVGTTPASIHANFAATFAAHLHTLHVTGGDVAVYKFLWSLSALQYYEMEGTYDQAPKPAGLPPTFLYFFEAPYLYSYFSSPMVAHAAFSRLLSVNLLYNSTYPGPTVPGGRKAVQKVVTIGGFPPGATMYEIWLEFATLPGVSAGESVVLAIGTFAGPIGKYFLGGYIIGTGISWFIQTYDPELQIAIGDLIGATIADISLAISIEAELQQQINAIDAMGVPGLNEADFDGIQLGAVTTSDVTPD